MDIRSAIQNADDKPLKPVVCSTWSSNGWDGTIYVRTMTGRERDEFEHAVSKATRKNDNRGLKLRLVLLTCCKETGELLFTDEDIDWLADKSAMELDRLANAALQANGFSEKDVADLEKN